MHPTVFRVPGLVATALSFALLTACSGGGTNPGATDTSGGSRTGSLQFVVPPRIGAGIAARKPAYVSPSIASVSITVTGVVRNTIVNVGPTSPDCTTAAGVRTCEVPFSAPFGVDTISVVLYDGPNATGHVLGGGSTTTDVAANGFSVAISVDGTPATLQLGSGTAGFVSGTPGTTTISVTVLDAGGNIITGTYASPVRLAVADSASAFSIEPATITASGQTATLTYNGSAGVTSVTVTANAASVASGSIVPVVIPVGPGVPSPEPLTLSTTFYQFNGTGITAPPITITGAAGTNFAAMTATSSDPNVATVAIGDGGRQLSVTSAGIGSTTITVVPSDGSATAATLTVQVQTTTVEPSIAKRS